jgi:FtsH-binding integral membrane protein
MAATGSEAMSVAATVGAPAESRERLFFLVTAFSLFYAAGLSSFKSPWWVHVHAVSFMTWTGFYLLQNTLVFRNDIALHRKLGRIGAGYAVWMVLVGLVLTPLTLAAGRSPPFFTPTYFLAVDWTNIVVFGALLYAAIRNRKRTDWHRRLMLCAMICLIAPALGRLVALSRNTPTAAVLVSLLLIYIFIAMLFDWANRRRIHAAYFWGAGALVLMGVVIELLALFPPFAALAGHIVS